MSRTRPQQLLFALLPLLTAGATPSVAQDLTGAIVVCADAEDGSGVPQADVLVSGPLLERSGITGADGCALLTQLEPGEWDVILEAPGRSTRIRVGVMISPGSVVRLRLELPGGDEIITDTDDRVLPDLSSSQRTLRDGESLRRRAGNNSLDALLAEMPSSQPLWTGSIPRPGRDLRRFGVLPPAAGIVRVDGVRVDGLVGSDTNPEWLDPRAFAAVRGADASGVPVVDVVPITAVDLSGGISLELSDAVLQISSRSRLDDFSRILARFGIPLVTGRASIEGAYTRTSGDWSDEGRGEIARLAEGWHVRSLVRWSDLQSSRILGLGGRRNFAFGEMLGPARESVSLFSLSHQLQRGTWTARAEGTVRSAIASDRERGSGSSPFRNEEEADSLTLELARVFLRTGADHDIRLSLQRRENAIEDERSIEAIELSDQVIAGDWTLAGNLRWSQRSVGSAISRQLDPELAVAWRPGSSGRRVLRFAGGRFATDPVDLTSHDPEESRDSLSLVWEESLGEWTVGEAGVARSETEGGAYDGASWSRGWLSVRRRYSSGYSVRGFARWLEVGDAPLQSPELPLAGQWSAGGELLVELPTGWSFAVTGDLREGLARDDTDAGMRLGNLDVRTSRRMSTREQLVLRVWAELRNVLDSDGVLGWSGESGGLVRRQPRTLVLGTSIDF